MYIEHNGSILNLSKYYQITILTFKSMGDFENCIEFHIIGADNIIWYFDDAEPRDQIWDKICTKLDVE